MKWDADLPEVNLQPGQVHLARRPMMLQTILGSCVSVTFWSARLGAAALCHGVLPRCPLEWAEGAAVCNGHRYVDYSIRYLARKFDALGADRKQVEVKVFGGADVLPVSRAANAKPTVGSMNGRAALEVLEEEGFTVLASDLGGIRGRKIHFHTGTGDVYVYKLNAWSESLLRGDVA